MPFIKPNHFTIDNGFAPPDFGGQLATMHAEISYTDTSSKELFVLPQNSVIADLYLDVKTAFNDSTSNSVTVTGADGSLLASVDVSSTGVTRYGSQGIAKSAYSKPTEINAVFTGGTGNASTGSALFVVSYYVSNDDIVVANQQSNLNYYPSLISNLGFKVWDWSTLNAGTLFQDSAKTTPASANGDVVGCWTDGVSGVDATQVTTANKPGLATASLNGLPTLSFDGGDLLSTGNISISTFAVWAVFRMSVSLKMIYEHNTNASANDGMFLYGRAINRLEPFVRRSSVNDSRIADSVDYSNFATWRHQHNGTNASHLLYKNNVLTSISDNVNNDVGTGTATAPLFIGARSGVTLGMVGNIAHLCIVSPYPTDASILVNMESYINNQWNGVY